MEARREYRIGIYVRESRDDCGENLETIETQREMLIDFARSRGLGKVLFVYEDDNVSGSCFEREGIQKLKDDVINGRIDMLLVKDLSRLGRNNAKTLQFLDFLEEYGIRVLSSDGRYDSSLEDDIVGIETWVNERYIRDISRKIRSSLRFKIQRGEYVGHAPFGYKKRAGEGNRLFIDEAQADTVRLIYRLYLSGLGYTAIASELNKNGYPSSKGRGWNRISVRRILTSSVYIGNTVQGVSERISFKNRKTRRLPKESWVVTEGTHEAIVSKEDFQEAQRMREQRCVGGKPHKGVLHIFRGLVWCGGCGSAMYARKSAAGTAYICGNYCRNGRRGCTSHFVCESELKAIVSEEIKRIVNNDAIIDEADKITADNCFSGNSSEKEKERLRKQLLTCRNQQDIIYADRLDGRISEQLFVRMNKIMEDRISTLEARLNRLDGESGEKPDITQLLNVMAENFDKGTFSNEIAAIVVKRITVFDPGDNMSALQCCSESSEKVGTVVIDFRMK